MDISQIFTGTTPKALLKVIVEKMYKNEMTDECWSQTNVIDRFRKLLQFCCDNFVNYHSEQDLEEILRFFNFDKFFTAFPEYRRVVYVLILKEFCKQNCLSENTFEQLKIEHLTEAPTEIRVTSNYNASISVAGGGQNYEVNQQKPATTDKVYMTDHPEIDKFIKYSFVLKHNFDVFEKSSHFQKLLMVQLSQFLVKKNNYIMNLYKNLNGSRFKRAGQYVLCDYLENLQRINFKIADSLRKYKIIPFLLEMNGKPGIGKSSYVDFLSAFLHQVFPFCDESDMVYNRVNDKFWNGYHQQPIVLYDDQNQNQELRYNLDNEIIALGSGQFVHPPMAFEKETKFSSLFVVFTTNSRLLKTTKANKGAIARRIHTYLCEPLEELGSYIPSAFGGEHWKYDDDVIFNPFNLTFNGVPFVHNLFDFLKFLTKQRTLQFDKQATSLWYVKSRQVVKREDLFSLLTKYVENDHSPMQLPSALRLSTIRAMTLNTKTLAKMSTKRVCDILAIDYEKVTTDIANLQALNMKAMLASFNMDYVDKVLKQYSDVVEHFNMEQEYEKVRDIFLSSEECVDIPNQEGRKLSFRSTLNTIELYYTVQSYNKAKISFCWIYDVKNRVIYSPDKKYLTGIERDRVNEYAAQLVEHHIRRLMSQLRPDIKM